VGRFGSLLGLEDIRVSDLGTVSAAGGSRARATVRGEELWFESDDAPMAATAELFATALLPIAVIGGGRLELDDALDPAWRRNAARVLRIWNAWWGTEGDVDAALGAPSTNGDGPGPAAGVGLCFTLGVDSFHTLLRSGYEVDRLVLAHGYDVPLVDAVRMDAARAALDEVGEACGCEPLVVRTNLREHPVGRPMDWERGHGGAIAALGHATCAELGELLISATIPYFNDFPWGSHFRTDPGWSSARLRVTHLGAELRRNYKLEALLDESLVQRHLRVCWENRAATGNCGECEKCARTMVILASHERLEDFGAFPEGDLVGRVEALAATDPSYFPIWKTALERLRDRRLRRAVKRLMSRSEPQQ
jgi:hypothetical protein